MSEVNYNNRISRVIAVVCPVIGLNDKGFSCSDYPQFCLRCYERVTVTQMQTAAHLLCCYGISFFSFFFVAFDVRIVERSMTGEFHISA